MHPQNKIKIKYFLLLNPIQFAVQIQWWSIFKIHLLHLEQWWDLSGLFIAQVKQYSLGFSSLYSFIVCLGIYPGSHFDVLNKLQNNINTLTVPIET